MSLELIIPNITKEDITPCIYRLCVNILNETVPTPKMYLENTFSKKDTRTRSFKNKIMGTYFTFTENIKHAYFFDNLEEALSTARTVLKKLEKENHKTVNVNVHEFQTKHVLSNVWSIN